MDKTGVVLAVVCGAVILAGAVNMMFQIYKMIKADAESRGLKYPRFWGFWAMNGNNSSGLVLYLIGRRKYPVIHMTEDIRLEIEKRKKRAGIGLIFLAIGAIGIIGAIFVM